MFIDEIQSCPRVITALRYFYEQMPELHVVAAGSMLEFAFGEISVPVGRVQYLHLQPMTFYEFLLAIGKEVMAEKLLEPPCGHPAKIVTAIHNQLRNYFFVGGMPEAVAMYRESGSMLEAYEVHSEIITSYREADLPPLATPVSKLVFAQSQPGVETGAKRRLEARA